MPRSGEGSGSEADQQQQAVFGLFGEAVEQKEEHIAGGSQVF